MKFNLNYLHYIIKDRGFTVDGFIAHLPMNKATFYRKVNKPSRFTYSDICEIIKVLNLNDVELKTIFFNN